ncbi:MAG: T9SS type A sorting domain-containing protein [Chlorobi bacterium]|nr:T9SS type A sorting domain-containing protein [Chlorobiota bacterium]
MPADLKLVSEELEKVSVSRELNLEWLQLGPDNMGGRTRAILFDQASENGSDIYAAGVSGGIFKSENQGTTWKKVNLDSYNLFVTCMTQAPNGDIYAGTGESFDAQLYTGLEQMGYTSGFMGTGIYKSAGGDNFSLLESTKPDFNNIESDWAFVNELASDPNNNRIYAATNTGLKYTIDGGTTWKTAKDSEGNELNGFAWDVQAGSNSVVVACVDNLAYVSANGDVTSFVLRSTGDSVSLPNSDVGRIKFAIAPSNPSIIYASVIKEDGDLNSVFRSEDGGQTWRVILPYTESVDIFSKQGIYDNALTVFPEDPDRVLIGGIDMWQGKMFQEQGYFEWKSVSQSLLGPLLSNYLHEDHHTYVFFPGSNSRFMVGTDGGVYRGEFAGDYFVYETSNRNYFTTQHYAVGISGLKNYVIGGTQDMGTIKITGKSNTKKEGEQIYLGEGGPSAISIINPDVIVITSTKGVIRRSDDGGVNYSVAGQFPGSDITNIGFRTPILLYENFNNTFSTDSIWYHARKEIPGGTTIQVRSHNGGQPFYYTTPDDVDLLPGDSIQVQDIVTCYLFVGVSNKIWYTKDLLQFDKSPEWFRISDATFGMQGVPYSLGLSGDGNHLFVGTDNGKLYRISNLNKATTFELADVSSPACIVSTQPIELLVPGTTEEITQVITSVSVNPENPNKVMLTLGNYGNELYVMYSENALDQFPQFGSRQGNLPHMPVYSSVLEMSNPDIAILGTEHGIFVTENISAESPSWKKGQTGMGSVAVFDLKQQLVSQPPMRVKLVNGNEVTYEDYHGTTNWGSIYAATYGRGLFRCDNFYQVGIADNPVKHNYQQLKLYPNPAYDHTVLELNSDNNKDINLYIYDLTGRMVHAQKVRLIKGVNKVRIDVNGFNKGTYILRVISDDGSSSSKFIVN